MQGVLSGLESVRMLVAANGATIMLLLLASRWVFSIAGMIRRHSSEGRSVAFNLIALVAYVAGAAHFVSEVGSNWMLELTGFFFALNILLILFDTVIIIDYRNTPVIEAGVAMTALAMMVAFFLGIVDLNALAAVSQ